MKRFRPGQWIPYTLREVGLMSEQLRCTCGARDKIERVLERIGEKRDTLMLGLGNCWWLSVPAKGGQHERVITFRNACGIPDALLQAADHVNPPKPKEREWRRGDYVKKTDRVDTRIDAGEIRMISEILDQDTFRIYRMKDSEFLITSKPGWSNLTIEAEQAGEK